MIFGSTFSGIEAASVAWHPIGWRPAFYSEIDKFPSAVLAHHYPDVPNLGDVRRYKEWPRATINLLVGGSPCQSFSVAGLRKGLADPRGNLALTFLGVADRYNPDWLLWENVPGVLSQDGGRAFGSILGGMAELGYHVAYRVLDAQYIRVDGFGRAVPQRRRRVFVVGHSRDWRCAAAVLFEPESLSGNLAPRREAGKDVAGAIARSSFSGGAGGRPEGAAAGHFIAGTLQHNGKAAGSATQQDAENGLLVASDVAHSVITKSNKLDTTFQTYQERAICENPDASPDGVRVSDDGAAYTLEARTVPQAVQYGWRVRRLMPEECEPLQGFPIGYTNIPWRGKATAPDGPRYKALGNSMAVNVVRWIGHRIEMVETLKGAAIKAA